MFGGQARDEDVGMNSIVEYTLAGPDVEHFEVEAATGVVKLRRQLTNRQTPYELRLTASDKGHPAMSSTVTLRVGVERHLDFPEIQDMEQEFSLPEDTEPGLFLTTIRTKSSLYSSVSYRYFEIASYVTR